MAETPFELDFKKTCNKKCIRKIQTDFSQEYDREFLPEKEAKVYEWYLRS